MNPQITIVIGTLNRPKIILSLINQLEKESKRIPLEVIVFNQGVEFNFPKKNNFSLIRLDKPNTCKYLNLGWKKAKAPIVLYLDDDVTITENSLTSHIEAYDDPSIQVVAGRVINDGEPTSPYPQVGKILWFGAEFKKNFSYEKQVSVDFPYGCNMSFRKIALEKVDGFDERLAPPIYSFNEVDIGYRINKNWPNSIIFEPNALVYHHQYKSGGTRNNFKPNDLFHGNQFNYGYFLGKNFSWTKNILCFFRRLPYQIIKEPKAISSILQGFIYGKKQEKK